MPQPRRTALKIAGAVMQQRRDALWPGFSADQFSFAAVASAAASANAGSNSRGGGGGKSTTIGLDETTYPLGSFTRSSSGLTPASSAPSSSSSSSSLQSAAAPALAFPNLNVNASFADFVYDYFLTRHGHRDGADLEFIDFFATSMSRHAISDNLTLFEYRSCPTLAVALCLSSLKAFFLPFLLSPLPPSRALCGRLGARPRLSSFRDRRLSVARARLLYWADRAAAAPRARAIVAGRRQ
jgi:hypothetical protein